ncbi:MAG: DNA-processing protein DprA [Nocardioidaceae bacterium]
MTAIDDKERRARIVMSRIVEPGDVDACQLISEHSAAALLTRLRSSRDHMKTKVGDWRERLDRADYDTLMQRAASVGARYVCPGDEEWLDRASDLAVLEDQPSDRRGGAPFGLWLRGNGQLAELGARSVAVVGARAATAYGEHVAGDLAFGCGSKGFTVVSGGAFGIDAAAHRGVLASGGLTVAVLASGIDRLYPEGNAQLLREISTTGLLVSEAAPGCVPTKSRFLVRNRLIAALSRGTVVVEAALRSGSLNTARWARDVSRPVMGIPGPVTSRSSEGVHQLLRQPETLLVTDADEVIEHISPAGEGLAPIKQGDTRPGDVLDQRSRQLLDALPLRRAATSQSIAQAAGLHHDDVLNRLVGLQHLGAVEEHGGKWRITQG